MASPGVGSAAAAPGSGAVADDGEWPASTSEPIIARRLRRSRESRSEARNSRIAIRVGVPPDGPFGSWKTKTSVGSSPWQRNQRSSLELAWIKVLTVVMKAPLVDRHAEGDRRSEVSVSFLACPSDRPQTVLGEVSDHKFARGPSRVILWWLVLVGRDEFRHAKAVEDRRKFGMCHPGLDGLLDGARLVGMQRHV